MCISQQPNEVKTQFKHSPIKGSKGCDCVVYNMALLIKIHPLFFWGAVDYSSGYMLNVSVVIFFFQELEWYELCVFVCTRGILSMVSKSSIYCP